MIPMENNVAEKFNGLILKFCDTSTYCDSLNSLHECMETILNEGYQMIDDINMNQLDSDGLYSAFESYLMDMTYDVAFFKITQFLLPQDRKLSLALEDMEQLDFSQIALPDSIKDERRRVQLAIAVFEKIGSYRTPADKLDCLLQTIFELTRDGPDHFLDSDSLIPLLLMTLIRSKVPHLTANLVYMKNYTFERNIVSGRYGYALSTFEGVLDYILTTYSDLSILSRKNIRFWSSIKTGDLACVKRMILNEYNATHDTLRDMAGNTPLMLACIHGQTHIVAYLLDTCSTRIRNDQGSTPLLCAVQHNHLETTRLLLQRDPFGLGSILDMDNMGYTAALYVCATHQSDMLRLLIESAKDKALLDHINPITQETALHIAVRNRQGSLDFLLYILSQMNNTLKSHKNRQGELFYHTCSHVEFLKYMLEHHGLSDDVMIHYSVDINNQLPIMSWAARGRLDLVELLITKLKKKQVLHVNKDGKTLLHLIATCIGKKNHASFGENSLDFIVEKLKDAVHIRDWVYGDTPLHAAVRVIPSSQNLMADSIAFIKALMKHGVIIDAVNLRNQRALEICKVPEMIACIEESCLKAESISNHMAKCSAYQFTWAVTRSVTQINENKQTETYYIIKSGQINKPDTMRTVKRSLQDFLFLRSELLYEMPEVFLPTLEHTSDPTLPPFMMENTLGKLQAFMDWILDHPILRYHDLVLSFTRCSTNLQRTVIKDKSFSRRKLLLEKINDTIPFVISSNGNGSVMSSKNEEYFLSYIRQTMLPLKELYLNAVLNTKKALFVGQELERQMAVLANKTAAAKNASDMFSLNSLAIETIQVCANMTYQRPFVSLWPHFLKVSELNVDVVGGILISLQKPFELLEKRNQLKDNIEAQKEGLQISKSWQSLFSAKESKRRAELEKSKMIQSMNELNQTDAQIQQSHKMISDELAHFQCIHPKKMIKTLRMLAKSTLEMEKNKLFVLDQTLAKWQKPLPPTPV
ncbi:uncharacterized protein B0P05DRAFT_589294 [Gilbertella persicaria]|uniref:uncharacterized protein n=1 Tax=Gilbertella persicaria TaxID=101096 RepID=UPI002220DAE9|nr:uncharacterized protein B0P05DRAFT_589294 [Gilbertella persicaria]KAI8069830.1 hypothetical protein B0P05DRAFT_589294 [Gilbertella persicaria]